jgi:hypothetical protein
MRALRLILVASIAALSFPAAAVAVVCAPPGDSGVDQYFETIPGSSCNVAPPGFGGPGSTSSSGGTGNVHLAPSASRQLAAQGPAGQAVARFIASTAPPAATTSNSHHAHAEHGSAAGSQPGAPSPAAPKAAGEGLIAGVLGPIVSGSAAGGVGVLLPIFLAAVLALGIATVVRAATARRRGAAP